MKTLEEYIAYCEEVADKYDTELNLINCGISNESCDKCLECASEHRQLAEWLRTLKDVKTAIKVGNKLLDQDGCDHEMAFDVYSSIYCQIEKLVEEVDADGKSTDSDLG